MFDFLESEGYIRLKADASISSKDCYDIYRMWCEENSLTALKRRSFSDALVAACGKYNLEHCNTITNSAGRRVWGFMGIEAVARPHINEFTGRFTVYVRTGRLAGLIFALVAGTYVRSDSPCYLILLEALHADKVAVPILGTTRTM